MGHDRALHRSIPRHPPTKVRAARPKGCCRSPCRPQIRLSLTAGSTRASCNGTRPSSAPFDPSASTYEGSSGQTEGLLPLTVSTANSPLTDGRVNASFVQWDTTELCTVRSLGIHLRRFERPDRRAAAAHRVDRKFASH